MAGENKAHSAARESWPVEGPRLDPGMDLPSETEEKPGFWSSPFVRIGLLILVVGLLVAGIFALPKESDVLEAAGKIRELGHVAILIYAVGTALLVLLAMPVTPLNVTAGLVFGPLLGFVAALGGSLLAAVCGFFLSRFVARDWVRGKLDQSPKWHALVDGVENAGFRVVLLTRMNPILPASIKNYGFGVTSIPFGKYILATVIGQIPGVALHVFLGAAGNFAILSRDRELSVTDYLLLAGGVAVSVLLAVILTKYGRQSLGRAQ